jgi:hypothetical protein
MIVSQVIGPFERSQTTMSKIREHVGNLDQVWVNVNNYVLFGTVVPSPSYAPNLLRLDLDNNGGLVTVDESDITNWGFVGV